MSRLNAKINELQKGISDEEVYKSREFKVKIQSIIDTVLSGHTKSPDIEIVHDESLSAPIAYTNGNLLHLNTGNHIAGFYTLPESKLIAMFGIVYHECAHIRYLPFQEEERIYKALKDSGELYGELIADTDTEKEYVKEIRKALQNENYRRIFLSVYHELSNIFSDVHDEACICGEFHGLVEKGITYSTESLRAQSQSAEELTEVYLNGNANALSVMYSLILQQARFNTIVMEDEQALADNEFVQKVRYIAPVIKQGTTEDDLEAKYTAINKCILVLWSYIRDMLDNSKSEQEGNDNNNSDDSSGSDDSSPNNGSSDTNSSENVSSDTDASDNGSNAGQSSEGQGEQETVQKVLDALNKGAANAMPQSSSEPSNRAQTSSSETKQEIEDANDNNGSSDTNSSENVSSDTDASDNGSNAGQSSDEQDEQETVQKVLDALNKGAANAMPQSSSEPSNRAQTSFSETKQETEDANDNNADNMSDEQAQALAKSILGNVKKEMARQKAEELLEDLQLQDDLITVNTVDMSSTHKGIPCNFVRDLNVTDADKTVYQKYMSELKPISTRLQKQILTVLQDMKDGCVLKHRQFGRKLESTDAYRLDGKCFSKKKLPQDLPDMAITVLIDQSASMSTSTRIESARKSAYLLYDFAAGLNIPISICGHCTANKGINFYQYTTFDKISNNDRYRLNHIKAKSAGNRDGMAINIAADFLSQRPEEVKILIIISDGQPADTNYGGEAAAKDIREIVAKYKKKGVQTFAAAIGDDRDRIREIYKTGYLDITDLSKLPKLLTNLVKKRIIS